MPRSMKASKGVKTYYILFNVVMKTFEFRVLRKRKIIPDASNHIENRRQVVHSWGMFVFPCKVYRLFNNIFRLPLPQLKLLTNQITNHYSERAFCQDTVKFWWLYLTVLNKHFTMYNDWYVKAAFHFRVVATCIYARTADSNVVTQ